MESWSSGFLHTISGATARDQDNEFLSISNWRASEASETLLVVVQWKTRYVYTYIYLASERSERDTLSRSSMENAIRIYIYIARCQVVVKF